MRTGHLEHGRVRITDLLLALAQTAGDDDLAVFGQRLADGVQRLLYGRVDEAAGIHHHHIGILVGRRHLVTLGTELGEDALGIDQRLGAAEADETDLGGRTGHVRKLRGRWRESRLCKKRAIVLPGR
jgi:hypothetical protein